MKKMLFIMNPFSGQKKANKVLPEILLLFSQAGYDVTVHMTTGQGSAAETAARLGPGMDLVVCCGGDGTFNETVSGLLSADAKVDIGYIPAGSTNDFAASLKLSSVPLQAAQDILDGEGTQYDVGKFADRYFSYVASFGAFTKVSYATPQSIKNALGHTAYLLEGTRELSQIRKEHVRFELDGEVVEDDFLFGAVCNSTSVGGILTLDPKLVDMADGLLEVLLVRAPRSLAEITECIQAVQSQEFNCAMITFRSAKSLKILASPDMPWTLDGERADGREEIRVENLHRAIRIRKKASPCSTQPSVTLPEMTLF